MLPNVPDMLKPGFEALLFESEQSPHEVIHFQQQPPGPQGASGSQVTYYNVTSRDSSGQMHENVLVIKEASLLERRVMQHLYTQKCAVPPVVIPNTTSEERAPMIMPFLEARPPLDLGHPQSPLTQSIADGLAGIHAANRKQPPSWLPHTSEDYLKRLWLYAWREQWEINLKDNVFAAEFGRYTTPLEKAMQQFMRVLESLTAEGETLTLLNVDLIPDHIRIWRGGARFIDWEQCSYGTLYLDLPNYFLIETALIYRDALIRHGYEIPVMEFLERYHEIGRYMGLRYLGHALWSWTQGGEIRQHGRWFLYYTLMLALNGR